MVRFGRGFILLLFWPINCLNHWMDQMNLTAHAPYKNNYIFRLTHSCNIFIFIPVVRCDYFSIQYSLTNYITGLIFATLQEATKCKRLHQEGVHLQDSYRYSNFSTFCSVWTLNNRTFGDNKTFFFIPWQKYLTV